MNFPGKPTPSGNAAKALLVLLSFSVLIPALVPAKLLRKEVMRALSPSQQCLLSEETLREFPDTNESGEEGETATLTARRKRLKSVGLPVPMAKLVWLHEFQLKPTSNLLTSSQTAIPQFENQYRNGCGAHLRC